MFAAISGSFVKKSGDKMTGDLQIDSSSLIITRNGIAGIALKANTLANGILELFEENKTTKATMLGRYLWEDMYIRSAVQTQTGSISLWIADSMTIPTGQMGIRGGFRAWAIGQCSGSGGTKAISIQLDSSIIGTFTVPTGTVNWWYEIICQNRSNVSVQDTCLHWYNTVAGGGVLIGTAAINTNSGGGTGVSWRGQLANAADTIIYNSRGIELFESN